MYSIALAYSMVALEEAVAAAHDRSRVLLREPAPLDGPGLAAHAAAWRRWAADAQATEAAPATGRPIEVTLPAATRP